METLRTLSTTFTQYRVVEAMECWVENGDDNYQNAPDTVVVIQDWRSVQGYQGLGAKLEGELLDLLARQERAADLNDGTLKVHVTNNFERALSWTEMPSENVARKQLGDNEFWLELGVRRSKMKNILTVGGFDRRNHHLLMFGEAAGPEADDQCESPVDEIFEAVDAAIHV